MSGEDYCVGSVYVLEGRKMDINHAVSFCVQNFCMDGTEAEAYCRRLYNEYVQRLKGEKRS